MHLLQVYQTKKPCHPTVRQWDGPRGLAVYRRVRGRHARIGRHESGSVFGCCTWFGLGPWESRGVSSG